MSKALDGLFTAIITGTMFGVGCCLTMEVLDLRYRVDQLEQTLEQGFEIRIIGEEDFGEPTLAPPMPVCPQPQKRSC